MFNMPSAKDSSETGAVCQIADAAAVGMELGACTVWGGTDAVVQYTKVESEVIYHSHLACECCCNVCLQCIVAFYKSSV